MGPGSEAGVTEGCMGPGHAVNLSSRAKTRDPLRAPVICKGQRWILNPGSSPGMT